MDVWRTYKLLITICTTLGTHGGCGSTPRDDVTSVYTGLHGVAWQKKKITGAVVEG